MKKSIIGVLILALLTLFLASCSKDTGEGNSPTPPPASEESYIYKAGSSLNVVCNDPSASELTNALSSRLRSLGVLVSEISDGEAQGAHEIVVGRSDRAVSKRAYRLLERLEVSSEDNTAYLIYSSGSSVAVAYYEDSFGTALSAALEFFADELIGEGEVLRLSAGTRYSEELDPLEPKKNEFMLKREVAWERIRKAVADEYGSQLALDTVAALKEYYTLYSEGMIFWFANLYDPEVGGYYYSNSARDTVGYLPDAESTHQALNFISGSGMAADYSVSLPDWMKKQIVSFVKGLQDESGYFYHPQWGKELTDINISRRSRDLTWCVAMLSKLGVRPTYDTPSGVKGDGILPAAALTLKLGNNMPLAVSRVLAVSDSTAAVAPHLRTKEALLEYLEKQNIETDSYAVGNELGSQAGEFLGRDKTLEAEGADWRASDIVIEYLDRHQNPVTGTWHSKRDYMGVNGLLKISGLYNSLGRRMNYPIEAAESAIAAITTDEEAQTICYPYNAWFSVTNIQKNLRNYYPDKSEGEALARGLTEALMKNAPASIAATEEKYRAFLKDDGSFSYLKNQSAANAQGMPVAIPGTNEGDVNATEIGSAGVVGHMFDALGLTKVSIFGEYHFLLYLRTLEKLEGVIKDEENNTVNYIGYENDTAGTETTDAEVLVTSSGAVTVERDLREGKEGNILSIASKNNGGDTVTFSCDSMRADAKCFVFETEMCFADSDPSGNIVQVILGNKAYMLNLRVGEGKVGISDVSSGSSPRLENDLGADIEVGSWFHLKVEYYPSDETNVRAKVFVNGELLGITDNYYDSTAARLNGRVGKPSQAYIQASVYVMSYHNATLLLDNTACYKTNTPYKPLTELDKQPYVNVDTYRRVEPDPSTGKGVYYNDVEGYPNALRQHYDLMGYPMPSLSGASYATARVEEGTVRFTRTAEAGYGESYLSYRLAAPEDISTFITPCSITELDFRWSGGDISADNAPLRFDDTNYIRFIKNTDGESYSLGEADTADIREGKWVNLRFEVYYLDELSEYCKVFVDGEYATTVRFGSMSPFNQRLLIYIKKGMDKGTVISTDNLFYCHTDKPFVPEEGDEAPPEAEIEYLPSPGLGEYFGGFEGDALRYGYADGENAPSVNGGSALSTVKGGGVIFLKTGEGEDYLSYSLAAPSSVGASPCTVIELDMRFTGLDPTYDNAPLRLDGGDFLRFVKNTDGESWSLVTKDTANIREGEWFNLRFEIYYSSEGSEVALIYVNGVQTATLELKETAPYNSRLLIYMKRGVEEGGVIFLDNILLAHIEKALTEQPDNPEGGDPEGGDPEGGDFESGETLFPGGNMAEDGWSPIIP